jgi:hypothetical protein
VTIYEYQNDRYEGKGNQTKTVPGTKKPKNIYFSATVESTKYEIVTCDLNNKYVWRVDSEGF